MDSEHGSTAHPGCVDGGAGGLWGAAARSQLIHTSGMPPAECLVLVLCDFKTQRVVGCQTIARWERRMQ